MKFDFFQNLVARAMGTKRTTTQPGEPQAATGDRPLRPGERRVGRQVVDTRGSASFERSAAAARHGSRDFD
jgi:hypothetical protein